ncbi:MAG TPA: HAD-IA family hydrolase [Candidatus Saccharimonadales bacterium]|nr:HAD-IA family hydrolase [Candidatus Saccharimonadales bacterium]
MKKYEYILLDWDGNLAKTLDIWLDAVRNVMEEHGIHKSDSEIGASFGQIVKHFEEWGLADPWAAFVDADRMAKRMLPEVELYPDALIVLSELHKAGKHLALITTSPRENVEHLLEKYELRQIFETVITGDDVTQHKPHPEPLEKALAELGGSKELAVMIGDSGNDLGAAQSFGVDSILFFPEEHHKFYDYKVLCALKPTHVVDDFKRVLEVV